MKFTLGDTGADSVGQGIRGIFSALAQAPLIREQMAQQAALRDAQTYHANMTGNKAGAEAAGLDYTLGQRKSVPETIAADPSMAKYMQDAYKLFQLTGDTNADRISQAAGNFQKQRSIADIQGGTDPLRTGQAYAAVSGHMPFQNAKAEGYSLNGLTGQQIEANPVVAKLYQQLEGSKINENNAQAGAAGAAAGLSNERRKEIQMGKVQPGMDENGNPILYRAGTKGDITVLEDLAPYKKAGGADAAAQKFRGQVTRDVYKDMMIAPEDKEAEIERRVNAASGKSAAPTVSAPKMELPEAARKSLKEGIVTSFKNGQKWTLRNGVPERVN